MNKFLFIKCFSFNRFIFCTALFNKKRTALSLIVTILSLWSISVSANETPAVYSQCVACHGELAQGNKQLKAPALAGQSAAYLTRQLTLFNNGLRGTHKKDILGKQMLVITKKLDFHNDVAELTSYLEALPTADIDQQTSGDLKNGSRYYQGKCGACHGGKAQGNTALNAPKLAKQSVTYLRQQMMNFSTGIRGTHSDDKFGRQMAMMAKTTSGQELEDILYFIAQQK